ncbi:MAG: hypothetical protein LGB71_02645 [Sulfurovum sp.]|nr:hypothetical protein [Sulfurovum sp.]MCB4766385.1 hypothetical protein [Sulfurovum sp.]MCB4774175.1 hypothetical protein [Sulfurovum sp.]MCB4777347.1 hypothetical protein [Sulfurovum sp.]
MTLSADNQKAFDKALAASTEKINSFYKADNPKTHFILFLEYLHLSKVIADLKEMDYNNEKMQEITEYVFERMPRQEILANVMTPEYFPDASEMIRYMMMPPEDLE